MRSSFSAFLLAVFLPTLCSAQQLPANAPRPWNQNPNGVHVYIQAGLKTHLVGQHDYPQFLADWSKILTEHGAIVDGSLHPPTAEDLAESAIMTAEKARRFSQEPRVAMLSFSNFGSTRHPRARNVTVEGVFGRDPRYGVRNPTN